MPDPVSQHDKAKAAKPGERVSALGSARKTYDVVHTEQSVWDAALERTERMFQLHDRVAVSFSGGKDSTATLHVALEVATALGKLPLRCVFYDEEAIPMQTEEYVRRVAERDDITLDWYCAPIESVNACSRRHPLWYPWDPDCPEKWVREKPPEGIDLPGFPTQPASARTPHYESNGLLFDPAHGTSVMLMGIRAQESLTRRRALTRKIEENYLVKYTGPGDYGHVWKGYPVYDWETTDVWAAPDMFGWDYNHAYDVMAMAGLAPSSQRCSPAFGNEPLQKLHTYATCFPEVWDKMTERVPGAAAAARYALTELYAYRGRPDKPEDMRWGEFLRSYLDAFDTNERRENAKLIASFIKLHFSQTTEPMVVDAPHPLSGVSWNWLLMLAMRGDPKGRKQPGARVNTNKMDHAWDRYRRELQTYADRDALDELNP